MKLGASRKEHIEAGLKKTKELSAEFGKDVRHARHNAMQVLKKLSKIMPEQEVKIVEDEYGNMLKKAELKGKKMVDAKEADL